MAGNKSLTAAARAKQDEFYTQLTDIEKELRYYKKHFKDKTVLCNCDDPFESIFFKYFVHNFNRLGLKKLIATCYTGSPIANKQLSLFDILGEDEETENKPYKAVVTTVYDKTGDGGVDMYDVAELFKSGENELCVIPEYQGKGIGTAAMEFIKTHIQDWKKITLVTPADKTENVKFYTERCGFEIRSVEMDGGVQVARFVLER